MSDDAIIEDEAEAEQPSTSSRPETKTGLLPWSYIFEIVTKQWAVFLIVSLGIAIFLYRSRQRRHKKKDFGSSIRRDHIQGGSQKTRTTYKKD